MVQYYVNGEFVDKENAVVSVLDHGLLYGDGVFEGIRAYRGKVFKLEEHMIRLYESAKTLNLDIGMSREDLTEKVLATLRRNEFKDAYIRLVVTRGKGDLGLSPRKCGDPSIIIITDEIQLYPKEYYENGLSVIIVSTVRNQPESINPRVKSLNYLNNIFGYMEVLQANAQEGIMLNREGYVCEACADNIFVVKAGKLLTPPCNFGALEGITRNSAIEIAEDLDYPVDDKAILTRHDLYNADEVFLTGSGAEIIAVVDIDGRKIGDGKPGEFTNLLLSKFRDYVDSHGTLIYKE